MFREIYLEDINLQLNELCGERPGEETATFAHLNH